MNKERLLLLADEILTNEHPFDMRWSHTCLIGFTNRLWSPSNRHIVSEGGSLEAQRTLDITEKEASELFFPFKSPDRSCQACKNYEDLLELTREQVAAGVRRFVAGEPVNYWGL